MVYKLFDKRTVGGAVKNYSNKESAEELYTPIIGKFKKSILIFYRQYNKQI